MSAAVSLPLFSDDDNLDGCVQWEIHAADGRATYSDLLREIRLYDTLEETTLEQLHRSVERLKRRGFVHASTPIESSPPPVRVEFDPRRHKGRAVSLRFTAVYGADPSKLPVPGDPPVLGVEPPTSAENGTRYMLEDGSVWEYLGIGPYRCDNRSRVNGWSRVGLTATDLIALDSRASG